MTEEDRQRTMDFILEQQAKFSINIKTLRKPQAQFSINLEALRETQARTDAIIAQIAGQLQNMARQQEHIDEVMAVMAESQQHTDERLNALIDIVQSGRNGNP